MQPMRKSQGVALLTALLTLAVLAGVSTLIFARMLSEMRHSKDHAAITQTLLLARSAASVGSQVLNTKVRDALEDAIEAYADTTSPWAFGVAGNGREPEPTTVALQLRQVARELQNAVDADLCGKNFASQDNQSATIRIYFTPQACGEPLPPRTRLGHGRFIEGRPRGSGDGFTQTYALPFVTVAEGRLGPYKRRVVAQGEFRFTLGRASFARYALFTNVHAMPDGTNVWFTDRTLFDGPVHTNNLFRFYRSPWFGGEVTSAGCLAPGSADCLGNRFYGANFFGEGLVRDTAMTPSPQAPVFQNAWGTHAPEFTQGVDWRAPFVRLPINNNRQRLAAQQNGLYFDGDVEGLKLSTETENGTTYQQIAVTHCLRRDWYGVCRRWGTELYRYASDRALYRYDPDEEAWVAVERDGEPVVFNGVIFAEGGIDNLSGPERTHRDDPETAAPALAPFAQITVAAGGTVRITGDLKYSDRPCESYPYRRDDGSVVPAVCNNLDALNVLGIYSQFGNVLIADTAPPELYIDAILMSARGEVRVENHDLIPDRGSVYLTGGIIEYFYGPFGTFNPATGQNQTGYARRFTYDRRMKMGLAPPFFPTTELDTVLGIQAFSFGQREQVY